MTHRFISLCWWECQNTISRLSGLITVLAFFLMIVALFPFALGVGTSILEQSAVGIIWICALLSIQLSNGALLERDFKEGFLEQILLHGIMAEWLLLMKILVHWLIGIVPLILLTPLLGLMLGMQQQEIGYLTLSLFIGTPMLSLLGGLGAALTLNARRNSVLIPLLILPLSIPILIFSIALVEQFDQGLGVAKIIIGIELLAFPIMIFAGGAAIRSSIENG